MEDFDDNSKVVFIVSPSELVLASHFGETMKIVFQLSPNTNHIWLNTMFNNENLLIIGIALWLVFVHSLYEILRI